MLRCSVAPAPRASRSWGYLAHSPLLALLGGEDWAAGTASWAVGPAAPGAAGWAAVRPSAVAGVGRSLEQGGAVALVALVVQTGEVGAAAADGACDEASVVFLVSKDPGFGGRCLNDGQ